MLVMALYNFVDVFWLSKVGSSAIAALAMSFPLQMIFGAIGIGTGIGAGSFVSRMFGAKQERVAHRAAAQAILIAAVFGLTAMFIGISYPDRILKAFGATETVLVLSKDYLVYFVASAPFLFFVIIASNLFRAEGNPNLSMVVVIISGIIAAALDPFLILGLGPFAPMGVKGAALSFLIGNVGTSFLSLYFLLSRRSRYRLKWAYFTPDFKLIREIYRVGFPSFIMNITLSLAFAVFNHVLGNYGPDAVAVLGILFRVTGIVTWILFGIGHGVMPLVGFSYGAHLNDRLVSVVRTGVTISAFIGGLSCVLLEVFARPVLACFSKDPALIEIAVPALRIYVSALVLLGPMIIWISMFNGLGKGFTSMFFLVARDTVFLIPFLFVLPLHLGFNGVWWAQPLSNGIVFLLLLFWAGKEIQALKKGGGQSEVIN